jgi:hypothetical protein
MTRRRRRGSVMVVEGASLRAGIVVDMMRLRSGEGTDGIDVERGGRRPLSGRSSPTPFDTLR